MIQVGARMLTRSGPMAKLQLVVQDLDQGLRDPVRARLNLLRPLPAHRQLRRASFSLQLRLLVA